MTDRILACLESHANARGVVIVDEAVLLRELGTGHEAATSELGKLERAGLVEILAPLPFLVLKLKKWSDKSVNAVKSATFAYSHSKQLSQTQRLKDSYRPGDEGDAPVNNLLREILETLGETDAASFEKAVELYSPHVIRTALSRVRRARGIRKSRTALFRHLLPRIARENRRTD